MQDEDRERFVVLLNMLASGFRVVPDEATYEAYWFGLEDIDLDNAERAVKQALRGSKFMPSVAELRELSGEEPVSATAVRAWQELVRSIRGYGAYVSVDFDDPALNATIRSLGGWVALCLKESEELHKWTRREFEKVYAQYAQYGVRGDAGRYLPGIHEENNRAGGHEVAAPIKIALPAPDRPTPLIEGMKP